MKTIYLANKEDNLYSMMLYSQRASHCLGFVRVDRRIIGTHTESISINWSCHVQTEYIFMGLWLLGFLLVNVKDLEPKSLWLQILSFTCLTPISFFAILSFSIVVDYILEVIGHYLCASVIHQDYSIIGFSLNSNHLKTF